MLGGELGVSQAFLALWYIGGGYIEVVVFYDCGKMYAQNSILSPDPSLIASNTTGMMHLQIVVCLFEGRWTVELGSRYLGYCWKLAYRRG